MKGNMRSLLAILMVISMTFMTPAQIFAEGVGAAPESNVSVTDVAEADDSTADDSNAQVDLAEPEYSEADLVVETFADEDFDVSDGGYMIINPDEEVITTMASGTTDVTLEVEYGQTEARTMLGMINDFRTGDMAWAWNESEEQVWYSGLQKLTYDYALERVAMQRAAEIATRWAHTRPNNENTWTAFPSGYWTMGENLAIGYETAEKAFVGLREDDRPYAGQGHRRNMLGPNFQAVGIGHAVVNGVHCWVQEFGSPNSGAAQTAAVDETRFVDVKIADGLFDFQEMYFSPKEVEVTYGQSLDVSDYLNAQGHFPEAAFWSHQTQPIVVDPSYVSEDPSVASANGAVIRGEKVGTTTVTATATEAGTTRSANMSVKVVPQEIGDGQTRITGVSGRIYNGSAHTQKPTVRRGTTTLVEGKDYKISYKNNTNAGQATMTVTGINNYKGTINEEFTITKASFTFAVTCDDLTYGTTPRPQIANGGNVSGGNVSYTYSSDGGNTFTSTVPKDAGSYKVRATIAETNNYNQSTATTSFKINKAHQTIRVSLKDTEYGDKLSPSISGNVSGGAVTFTYSLDGGKTYQSKEPVDVGTYMIKAVTAETSNYFSATATSSFKIVPADLSKGLITLPFGNYVYDGGQKKPKATVSLDGKTLKEGTDYTITYSNNTNPGVATVSVTGKGNYKNTLKKTFVIEKRDSAVDFTIQDQVFGSKPQPSVTRNTSGGKVTFSYSKDGGATFPLVSAPTDVGEYIARAVLAETNYDKSATMEKGFKITAKDASKATVSAADMTYNGKAQTPSLTVKLDGVTLTNGKDYDVQKVSGVDAGKYNGKITFKGNYKGQVSYTFTIRPYPVSSGMVSGVEKSYPYVGKKIEPKVTLTDRDMTMVEGKDYKITYKNSDKPGSASVYIEGIGNYTKTATVYYTLIDTVPVYRLFNPKLSEHLFTTDANEVRVLTEKWGWIYEGIGWYAPARGVPVYRLFSPKTGEHLYTTDLAEVQVLTKRYGWQKDFDGKPLFYSGGDVAIYRLFNPNTKIKIGSRVVSGRHHWTTSKQEYEVLAISHGWQQEGKKIDAAVLGDPNAPMP